MWAEWRCYGCAWLHRLACTDSGLVLDVDCDNMSVGRVWQLSPPTAPIGVTCLKVRVEMGTASVMPLHAPPGLCAGLFSLQVHECFAVSGHEDGSLCVWPADFSKVLLEAHHDAPIQSLDVSLDGMTVLTATQAVSEYEGWCGGRWTQTAPSLCRGHWVCWMLPVKHMQS